MQYNDEAINKIVGKARTHWMFGDWKNLSELTIDENLPCKQEELQELEVYRFLALIQLSSISSVDKEQVEKLRFSTKEQLGKALLSGTYNALGKANVLIEDDKSAEEKFRQSIEIGCPDVDVDIITRARFAEQKGQMGIATLWEFEKEPYSTTLNQHFLFRLKDVLTDEPGILIALAERAQASEKYVEAINHWQELASVLEERMPQVYYDRLSEAYKNQESFPLGSDDEEYVTGSGDKHQLLKEIHKLLKPRLYLEIGVQTGKSLVLAECPAIGVDPMPQLKSSLKNNIKLVRKTSDDFFASCYIDNEYLDLAFIDGMHLFEYALRDFINIERLSHPGTLVIIDDIYPNHSAQAERNRRTRAWTGDVWKLHAVLKEFRPDLTLRTLDAYPTGLMMIGALNPRNEVLKNCYDEVVARYKPMNDVPNEYLKRSEAWSCDDVKVTDFLKCFNSLRGRGHESISRCLHEASLDLK